MLQKYVNWRIILVLTAMLIVLISLIFTGQMARKLAIEERSKVKLVAEGIKSIATAQNDDELSFATYVITQDTSIPRIITDASGNILDIKAIDTNGVNDVKKFLSQKIETFKKENNPIIINYHLGTSYIYFGESYLLNRLKFFPYIQLAIIGVFLIIVIVSLRTSYISLQNQIWVGLSKETAHQLGTPISSIEGWIELLLLEDVNHKEYLNEIQKDVVRLKLVADRFSKIGSIPVLKTENIITRIEDIVSYMQKRAPEKVNIQFGYDKPEIMILLSGAIFDWVIENLIRNSLDALGDKGSISLNIKEQGSKIIIDIADNGKGISKHLKNKIFQPGFSTKKRGWGLGLSLSKRIIEKYHKGSLILKQSEAFKNTTFRIILNKI